MRLGFLSLFIAFSTQVSAETAARPSFDCAKASSPDERVICSDPRLSELDRVASIAFGQVPKELRKDARETGAEMLAQRRACGIDRLCILDQQVGALESFKDNGAKVPVPAWVGSYRLSLFEKRGEPLSVELPTKIGQCTRSKITAISGRFGGKMKPPNGIDNDPGAAVSFADRGSQVSYSYEDAIAKSSVGDEVLLCLVSVPKNCPKGDDRGKFYSATNLRTQGSWELPDSEHMCGGA